MFFCQKLFHLNNHISLLRSIVLEGLGQGFHAPACRSKVGDDFGKDKSQVSLGFQAVVQHDDGAWLHVVEHVGEALFGRYACVVVTAQDIPHDDPKMPFEEGPLRRPQPSVRRAEEGARCHPRTSADIVKVPQGLCFRAIQVVKRVVSNRMPL